MGVVGSGEYWCAFCVSVADYNHSGCADNIPKGHVHSLDSSGYEASAQYGCDADFEAHIFQCCGLAVDLAERHFVCSLADHHGRAVWGIVSSGSDRFGSDRYPSWGSDHGSCYWN